MGTALGERNNVVNLAFSAADVFSAYVAAPTLPVPKTGDSLVRRRAHPDCVLPRLTPRLCALALDALLGGVLLPPAFIFWVSSPPGIPVFLRLFGVHNSRYARSL